MKVYKKLLSIFAIILILLPTLFGNMSFNTKAQGNYRTYYFTNPNMGYYFMGNAPNRGYYLQTLFGSDEYLAILLSGNLMIFKRQGDLFYNLFNVSLYVGSQYGLFYYNTTHLGVYTDYYGFRIYLVKVSDGSFVSTNVLNVGGYTYYLYSYGFVHYFLCVSGRNYLNLIKLEGTNLVMWTFPLEGNRYPIWAAGYYNPSNNKLYMISLWYGSEPLVWCQFFDFTSQQFSGVPQWVSKSIEGVFNGKFLSFGIHIQDIQIVGNTYNFYLSVTGTWKITGDLTMRTRDSLVKVSFTDNGNSVSNPYMGVSTDYIFIDQMSFSGSYKVSDSVYSFYFYAPTKSYFQVIRNNTKGSANYYPIDISNLQLTYPFWFTTWGFVQLCNNNQDVKLFITSGGNVVTTVTPGQTVTTSTYYPTTTYYTTQPFIAPDTNVDFLTNVIVPLTIVSIPALLLTVYLGAAGLIVGLLLGGGLLFYSGYAPFGLIFLIILGAVIVLWRGGSGKSDGG